MTFEADLIAARPCLSRFAVKLTRDRDAAEDLLSDTMVRALANRDKFQEGTNLRAWAYFIMRNQFLSAMRRKKWDGGSTSDLTDAMLPSVPAPQGVAIDLADALKALAEIPADQREAVLMVGAGATYEEVADELLVSLGTVKSRVCRGRDALIELLS